jgi:hypothetical protein
VFAQFGRQRQLSDDALMILTLGQDIQALSSGGLSRHPQIFQLPLYRGDSLICPPMIDPDIQNLFGRMFQGGFYRMKPNDATPGFHHFRRFRRDRPPDFA